jgi:glutamate-1-semialdehyde 2,1-aminomutase
MFALFFAEQPVRNFSEATASNTRTFKKLFNHSLKNGVYLPPSPFETCFISTAHTDSAIERTIEVMVNGIRSI